MAYWTVEIQNPGDELFAWSAVRVIALQKGRNTVTALIRAEPSTLEDIRQSSQVLSVIPASLDPILRSRRAA